MLVAQGQSVELAVVGDGPDLARLRGAYGDVPGLTFTGYLHGAALAAADAPYRRRLTRDNPGSDTMRNDLQQRLAFIHEIDKVKQIYRQTYLLDGKRFENDAEHSWHLAVMAVTLRALWDEFEARETPEATFACALDRLQPLMHNYLTQGRAWREHGVTADQVLAKNRAIASGSFILGGYAASLIHEAVERGYLLPAKTTTPTTKGHHRCTLRPCCGSTRWAGTASAWANPTSTPPNGPPPPPPGCADSTS